MAYCWQAKPGPEAVVFVSGENPGFKIEKTG